MTDKKKFKLGDKVKIISSEQTFYIGLYQLTTFVGVVLKGKNRDVSYVDFNNSKILRAILSKDLELVAAKGEQLLFSFMVD